MNDATPKKMTLSLWARKFILATHIAFSVGWFGAVATFVALNIVGINSSDNKIIGSSYIAMNLIAWYIILPFCIVSFLTGLIQAIFTQWGLFKHYWIIAKLVLTTGCTLLLIVHMQSISEGAILASSAELPFITLKTLGTTLFFKAAAALIVLLLIIAISIYKPWGKVLLTRSNESVGSRGTIITLFSKKGKIYIVISIITALLLLLFKHISSGGMNMHNHK